MTAIDKAAQQRKNLRTGLILGSIAVVLLLGFLARVALMGR